MKFLSKFPSYDYIYKNAVAGLTRFPFTMVCALLGTASAVYLAEENIGSVKFILQKILMVSGLGLPLFIALVVFGEKKLWSKKTILLSQLIGAVLLILYYFSLPDKIFAAYIYSSRIALLYIGLHFLVAFMPFWGKNQIAEFWQFNKSLFLRILLAALYSAVMFIGLLIALMAADHLFGFDIREVRHFQLWLMIVGLFYTWVFIAGIPRDLKDLKTIPDYPAGLKIFTQYILLPLVGLYFIILFTYEAKIIFTWNWPKGWVSHLVLWYSVVGILSMLLLYPLKDKTENRWIRVFSKWFYIGLVPLVLMLFIAIFKRISEYGLTENRYFVLAMAIGLAVVVIYFIISRLKDIRIIPIVLCCLAFLSAYGPWSAFSVSKANQFSRLVELMEKNNLLVDGVVSMAAEEMTFEDQKEISSIIGYLNNTHGTESFSVWFDDSTLNSLDTLPDYSQAAKITELMGFKFIEEWDNNDRRSTYSYSPESKDGLKIMNYDYLVDFAVAYEESTDVISTYIIDNDSCRLKINQDNTSLQISFGGNDLNENNEIEITLIDLLTELNIMDRKSKLPVEKFSFISECDDFNAKVIFRNISGNKNQDRFNISNLTGHLLVRKL